ncbi:ROK family protein [Oscillospiraceae bacterium PP1C4]
MRNIKNALHLEEMQNNNRALVLKAVHGSPRPTRISVAKATKLNRATITNIVSDLIRYELLEEGDAVVRTKGRWPVLLSFSDKRYRIIGVRITRTYFTVGVYGLSGTHYDGKKVEHPPGADAEQVMDTLMQTVRAYWGSFECETLGIGVSMPGPVFLDGEVTVPIVNFAGWEKINVKSRLHQAFQVPVLVEQDANAAALLEWYRRANNDDVMLYLEVAQGVGSALVVHGQLFKGVRGGAGEIGHMCIDMNGPVCACGSKGCLERYCSSLLLVQQIRQQFDDPTWTLTRIIDAFHQQKPLVVTLVLEQAYYLGIGIANSINLYNPNLVVVAGEYAAFGSAYLEAVIQSAQQYALPALFSDASIEFPYMNEQFPSSGGANLILDALMQNPGAFLERG